jgi:hypothetical protein
MCTIVSSCTTTANAVNNSSNRTRPAPSPELPLSLEELQLQLEEFLALDLWTQSLHPLSHTSEHNRYHTTIDESLHLTSDEPPTEPQERTQPLPYNDRRIATPHE